MVLSTCGGVCGYGAQLPVDTSAGWDRLSRTVVCLDCLGDGLRFSVSGSGEGSTVGVVATPEPSLADGDVAEEPPTPASPMEPSPTVVDVGNPGSSLQAEYEKARSGPRGTGSRGRNLCYGPRRSLTRSRRSPPYRHPAERPASACPPDQGPSENRDPEAPTGPPSYPPGEILTTTNLTRSTTRIQNLMKTGASCNTVQLRLQGCSLLACLVLDG